MKTEATKQADPSPLQAVDAAKIPKEKAALHIIYKSDANGLQSSPQQKSVFKTGSDDDPSWYANYE